MGRSRLGKREQLPDAAQGDLDTLVALPKRVPRRWRVAVQPMVKDGQNLKRRLHLPDHVALGGTSGQLFVFTRVAIDDRGNFSVGIAFEDGAGHVYRLLRFNGQHPSPHVNRLGEQPNFAPYERHVHIATESYIKARDAKHDGLAIPAEDYNDYHSALDQLSLRANLTVDGMLWP